MEIYRYQNPGFIDAAKETVLTLFDEVWADRRCDCIIHEHDNFGMAAVRVGTRFNDQVWIIRPFIRKYGTETFDNTYHIIKVFNRAELKQSLDFELKLFTESQCTKED